MKMSTLDLCKGTPYFKLFYLQPKFLSIPLPLKTAINGIKNIAIMI